MESALILEDHPPTRDWLGEVVTEAFGELELATADTLAQGLALIGRRSFDLAVVDLGLPDGRGSQLVAELNRTAPQTLAVVATIFDDDRHLFDAITVGAHGYLLKEEPREQLVARLAGIQRGEPPLSPAIARRLLRHFTQDEPESAGGGVVLSRRELEVLDLLSRGFNRSEIADCLAISVHTAAGHMKSVYRKLHVSGRAEAVREGIRRGLIRL